MEPSSSSHDSPVTAEGRLRDLRIFDGSPPAFWVRFTEVATELAGALQGRSIVRLGDSWNLLATAPEGTAQGRLFLSRSLGAEATAALHEGLRWVEETPLPGFEHLLVPLTVEDPSQLCLLELVFSADEVPADAEALATRLALLADTPRVYQRNLAAQEIRRENERTARALDVLAMVNEHQRFAPAAMTLVNELAHRFGAERATLGWARNYYLRIVAISGTERFQRKMQVLQQLEAAMEESKDQDEEILLPAPPGQESVVADHQQYSRDSQSGALLSGPLRVEGESVGVLTVERESEPFTEEDARALRVILDQCAPRLVDLRRRDRWFGARWAAGVRRLLAKVLSPRHTWLKLAVVLATAFVIFSLVVPFRYAVDTTFQVRADTMSFVSAPFEGYLEEALVRPGDVVAAGQVVLAFEREDLLIEEAEALAQIQRFRAEAELAEAEGNLADLRVARAQLAQAEARLDLAQHRLERASLRAPFDGVVVQGDFRDRVGARIQQGEQLLLLSELEGLYAEIRLPERDIDLIGDHRRARLVFASRPDKSFPATIEMLSPAAYPDQEGNAFALRAQLDEEAPWLRPGMTGVSRIEAGQRTLFWRATHRIIDFIRLKLWI